jgi:hypothetical protein
MSGTSSHDFLFRQVEGTARGDLHLVNDLTAEDRREVIIPAVIIGLGKLESPSHVSESLIERLSIAILASILFRIK